jgi:hypothetical protein
MGMHAMVLKKLRIALEWTELDDRLAEAVCAGKTMVRIRLPMLEAALKPESPLVGDWLDRLREDITVIKIELLDETAQGHAEGYLQKQGQRLVDMGRRMLHKKAGGESLHAALDAYARSVSTRHVGLDKKPTLWSGTQGRQIAFLPRHLPDVSLGELDAARIEELVEVLRLRPLGQSGEPVSISWPQGCLKLLRRFLRWLHKTAEFAWKWPADLDLLRVQIPRATGERASPMTTSQVETYSLDELATLWQYASPFQRLLMLLALNCGFGKAEIASLDRSELFLHQKHPCELEVGCRSNATDSWIFRVRPKSGVYGEFKLWPMTVRALEWWLQEREKIECAAGVTTVLVNASGRRYDEPTKGNHPNMQIPNSRIRLTDRIREKEPEFRRPSFNKLRKTAGNLVRAAASGEVAAVFLCHGEPVGSDALLDLYTNRPFAKVFLAIDLLDTRLANLK